MSKRKYRLDVCPECKVKEGVSSRKRVYQCTHCARWFCEMHLEPRFTVRESKIAHADPTWRNMVEKEWRKKGGHPDSTYTLQKIEPLLMRKYKERHLRGSFLGFCARCKKPVYARVTGIGVLDEDGNLIHKKCKQIDEFPQTQNQIGEMLKLLLRNLKRTRKTKG